ncbi:furin-like protease 1 isoform X2 [Anabrus simplex]|uniref:furin-like protease 1 isoform X2 n=1 Tax=Anabrus simplex TaxID=316456 RepID=UPI0035A3C047
MVFGLYTTLHNNHNNISKYHDLNVEPVWKMGWTGLGVTLSVLDDGLQYSNIDIGPNYEPSVSYDVADLDAQDTDPSPNMNSSDNSHGTHCAAIMAAVANNSYCGVGVAYEAKVGGVRLLEGAVTDLQESLALSYGLHKVDIFSASWGPKDDGVQVDGPRKLATAAFQRGVTLGRNGKGVIYVWAVGNGGYKGDNCNLDGYASSIYTLSVNSLTEEGLSCFYDEPCSSTLASVYVGGHHHHPGLLKRKARTLNVVVPELNGQCRDSFQGTSAAAPMAAGVIALVLQANPNLTWRDMQHLVVQTAMKTNDTGWRTNSAGFHYHLIYGFGSLNALKMVTAALNWKNVPEQRNFTLKVTGVPRKIEAYKSTVVLTTVDSSVYINYLEHVVVTLTLKHRKRGLLEMFIISPSGTVSQILTKRKNDFMTSGFKNWKFMSVNLWGENPVGVWQLRIINHSNMKGQLLSATYQFFGYHS